jgi:hypothetical protein
VSDHCAHRREMLLRTAKSCGPDAPALASSWRSFVGPTGCRQNLNPQATVTTSRSPGRARRKPLKPLRAGAPGDPAVPVVTTRVLSTFAHEAADAAGIRRSPRPLFEATGSGKPRAHRAERSRSCILASGCLKFESRWRGMTTIYEARTRPTLSSSLSQGRRSHRDRFCNKKFSAVDANTCMLASRSALPVSSVITDTSAPATPMQLWPAASP